MESAVATPTLVLNQDQTPIRFQRLRSGHEFTVVRCAFTVGLVLCACGVTGTSPGNAVAARSTCWQQVIRDWTAGHVDDTYAPRCYRDAVSHLPEDLRTYSSAPDDINRALLEATSRHSRSIAAARPTLRRLDASVATPGQSPPLAAVLFGALGGVVVVSCTLSAWLVARRR